MRTRRSIFAMFSAALAAACARKLEVTDVVQGQPPEPCKIESRWGHYIQSEDGSRHYFTDFDVYTTREGDRMVIPCVE